MISFQADVVIKFPEEDAPSTVQSKNIFVPKPEIQVQSKTKFMCRDGGLVLLVLFVLIIIYFWKVISH